MSREARDWAYAQCMPELKSGTKFTLVALAEFANPSGYCWPGLDLLMQRTNIKGKTNLIRHIDELERLGLISVKRDSGKVNRYYLNLSSAPITNQDQSRIETAHDTNPDILSTSDNKSVTSMSDSGDETIPPPVTKQNATRNGMSPEPSRTETFNRQEPPVPARISHSDGSSARYPGWFQSLMDMPDYRDTDHHDVIIRIEQVCKKVSIDPMVVADEFLRYYRKHKNDHPNWTDPVSSFARNVDAAIAKCLGKNDNIEQTIETHSLEDSAEREFNALEK